MYKNPPSLPLPIPPSQGLLSGTVPKATLEEKEWDQEVGRDGRSHSLPSAHGNR